MRDFIYQNKTKVFFGNDKAKEYLDANIKNAGKTIMLAYGQGSVKKTGIYDEVVSVLKANAKEIVEFPDIMPNPTLAKVKEGAKLANEHNVDFILAVGGGSVMDCAKMVAAQAKIDECIWEYEKTKGKLPAEFIPCGALVTASGTGSEVNNGAVITNEDVMIKAGMTGASYDFAILDVEYTMSVPMMQVMSGAFDSISHCFGSYFDTVSNNNITDDIAEAVMKNIMANMKKVYNNPNDREARGDLIWGSSVAMSKFLQIGKICSYQAHQIEHQLGAYTDCNHGQGLAVIHPAMFRHIYKNDVAKFARFAERVMGVKGETEEKTARLGIEALAEFIASVGLPTTLREMGITNEHFKEIADSTPIRPGCPKVMTSDEILEILNEVAGY